MGKLRFLQMPEKDHSGNIITAANAGNNQRVDLPMEIYYCPFDIDFIKLIIQVFLFLADLMVIDLFI